MNLIKFKLFESLYESNQSLKTIIQKVKESVGNNLYYIPEFQKIHRSGEPEQISYLFSDKEGHTFSLNFSNENHTALYSIDFWLPTSDEPEATLYVENNEEEIITHLPELMKNPVNTLKESENTFRRGLGAVHLEVVNLGGDRYDGGVAYEIRKDGKKIDGGLLDGDWPVEYNGKKYDGLKALANGIGAQLVSAETEVKESFVTDVNKRVPAPHPHKHLTPRDKFKLVKPKKHEAEISMDDSINKAEKELEKVEGDGDYEYGDPDTMFEDLRKYTRMVIQGPPEGQAAMLVTGQAGLGKTYITKDEINKSGLEKGKDWVKVKGKTTPAALYLSLYRHNGKLIIYDDCDSVFKDDDACLILKGALDTDPDERTINWDTAREIKDPDTGKIVPRSFDFNGRVIFLSNKSLKSIDKAIKSRAFCFEVALSPKDMIAYIEKKLPAMMPDESMTTKKIAFNTIKAVAQTDKRVQINMRTVGKAVAILKSVDDLGDAKRLIRQQCRW